MKNNNNRRVIWFLSAVGFFLAPVILVLVLWFSARDVDRPVKVEKEAVAKVQTVSSETNAPKVVASAKPVIIVTGSVAGGFR